MKHLKLKTYLISEQFFQYALVTYLILLLAETVKEGFVTFFFDLNILLGIVLLSGVVMAITHQEKYDKQIHSVKNRKLKAIDIVYILLLAAGSGLLVWYKTLELGWLSIVISALTSVLVFLVALLVFTDRDQTNQ